MAAREDMGTPIAPGVIDRIVQGFKLVFNGKPDQSFLQQWMGPGPSMQVTHQETAGRAFDYPFGVNLNFIPRGESGQAGISFSQLRGLADSYDLLRLAIETRKDQIESYDWEIGLLDEKQDPKLYMDEIKEVTAFLERPDKEHDWDTWLRMSMEELLVLDAWCIHPRPTMGGGLYALELVDGSTIKRLIDDYGRTPDHPQPAYQQIIKGMPASEYTRDDLLYLMKNPRIHRIYGLSPVEQVIVTVNIAIRRQLHQLNFYTEGNVPEAIAGVPDTWTMDQIKMFQEWWDTLVQGNMASKRHMKFIPRMEGIVFPKAEVIKDAYDEWLARIICYCFSISPNALVHQVNRAQAQQVAETAKEEGLMPWLNWIATQMTFVLKHYMNKPHLKFAWKLKGITDPGVRATVHATYIDKQVLTPDEVREEIGKRPLTAEERALAFPQQPMIDPLTGLPMEPDAAVDPATGEAVSSAVVQAFQEEAGGQGGGEPADASTDRIAAAFKATKGRRAYGVPVVKVHVAPPVIKQGDTFIRVMPSEPAQVIINGEERK